MYTIQQPRQRRQTLNQMSPNPLVTKENVVLRKWSGLYIGVWDIKANIATGKPASILHINVQLNN